MKAGELRYRGGRLPHAAVKFKNRELEDGLDALDKCGMVAITFGGSVAMAARIVRSLSVQSPPEILPAVTLPALPTDPGVNVHAAMVIPPAQKQVQVESPGAKPPPKGASPDPQPGTAPNAKQAGGGGGSAMPKSSSSGGGARPAGSSTTAAPRPGPIVAAGPQGIIVQQNTLDAKKRALQGGGAGAAPGAKPGILAKLGLPTPTAAPAAAKPGAAPTAAPGKPGAPAAAGPDGKPGAKPAGGALDPTVQKVVDQGKADEAAYKQKLAQQTQSYDANIGQKTKAATDETKQLDKEAAEAKKKKEQEKAAAAAAAAAKATEAKSGEPGNDKADAAHKLHPNAPSAGQTAWLQTQTTAAKKQIAILLRQVDSLLAAIHARPTVAGDLRTPGDEKRLGQIHKDLEHSQSACAEVDAWIVERTFDELKSHLAIHALAPVSRVEPELKSLAERYKVPAAPAAPAPAASAPGASAPGASAPAASAPAGETDHKPAADADHKLPAVQAEHKPPAGAAESKLPAGETDHKPPAGEKQHTVNPNAPSPSQTSWLQLQTSSARARIATLLPQIDSLLVSVRAKLAAGPDKQATADQVRLAEIHKELEHSQTASTDVDAWLVERTFDELKSHLAIKVLAPVGKAERELPSIADRYKAPAAPAPVVAAPAVPAAPAASAAAAPASPPAPAVEAATAPSPSAANTVVDETMGGAIQSDAAPRQLGGTAPFTAGHERHRLWIELRANRPVVMVASDPTELIHLLETDPTIQSIKAKVGDKSGVSNALGIAKKLGTDAGVVFGALTAMRARPEDQRKEWVDNESGLKGQEKNLLGALITVFELVEAESKAPRSPAGEAGGATTTPAEPAKTAESTPPAVAPPGAKNATPDPAKDPVATGDKDPKATASKDPKATDAANSTASKTEGVSGAPTPAQQSWLRLQSASARARIATLLPQIGTLLAAVQAKLAETADTPDKQARNDQKRLPEIQKGLEASQASSADIETFVAVMSFEELQAHLQNEVLAPIARAEVDLQPIITRYKESETTAAITLGATATIQGTQYTCVYSKEVVTFLQRHSTMVASFASAMAKGVVPPGQNQGIVPSQVSGCQWKIKILGVGGNYRINGQIDGDKIIWKYVTNHD